MYYMWCRVWFPHFTGRIHPEEWQVVPRGKKPQLMAQAAENPHWLMWSWPMFSLKPTPTVVVYCHSLLLAISWLPREKKPLIQTLVFHVRNLPLCTGPSFAQRGTSKASEKTGAQIFTHQHQGSSPLKIIIQMLKFSMVEDFFLYILVLLELFLYFSAILLLSTNLYAASP